MSRVHRRFAFYEVLFAHRSKKPQTTLEHAAKQSNYNESNTARGEERRVRGELGGARCGRRYRSLAQRPLLPLPCLPAATAQQNRCASEYRPFSIRKQETSRHGARREFRELNQRQRMLVRHRRQRQCTIRNGNAGERSVRV